METGRVFEIEDTISPDLEGSTFNHMNVQLAEPHSIRM